MSESNIYQKTEKGKQEIANPSGVLAMLERRVLILLNGTTTIADARKRSLVNDFDTILKNLLSQGYVESTTASKPEPAPVGKTDRGDLSAPRDLMVNTLKSFGNQMRIKGLVSEIESATDVEGLKNLLPKWYQAISDTPNGMYQADDLRVDLKKLLGI